MKTIIKKTVLFLPCLYKYRKEQQLSVVQKQFASSLTLFRAQKGNDGILLVQMVKDYEYTVKFAAAANVIASQNDLDVSFYDVDWMKWIGWSSKPQQLHNYFAKTALEKIYLHFGSNVLFRCETKYSDREFIKNKLQEIQNSLSVPEDILQLKFESIAVGDLIYDTYLRYFHQPTIENLNKDVFLTIEIALNVFYNFSRFLETTNVKALLNTYSSYIEHGITARICLAKNIPVYTVGSYSYLISRLKKDFPFHQINHTLFDAEKQLDEQQLALSKQRFTARFEGKIDAATSYMRHSAFGNNAMNPEIKKLFAERKRNVVIYAHDFYDSPHVNRLLQFPDLYQFLKQTLAALTELCTTTVFIKIHPNGIEGCKEKTIALVEGFNCNHFKLLDESVSNLNIIELRPDLIASARGTVCAEMAHFNIPTVALFDNLFANFDFTHTCSSTAEYFSILKGEIQPQNDFNKNKIYSFYYQAFLEQTDQTENPIFQSLSSFKGNTYNDKYLQFLLTSNYAANREHLYSCYANALKVN